MIDQYADTQFGDNPTFWSNVALAATCRSQERARPRADLRHMSTSHVERQNLKIRMQIRPFTRLTNAFSNKLDNHKAACALRRVLQFLPDTQDPALHSGDGERNQRSHTGVAGVNCRLPLFPPGTMLPVKMEGQDFTRRSGTESVCMHCFATVRATKPESLEAAERDHAFVCLEWPIDLRISPAKKPSTQL